MERDLPKAYAHLREITSRLERHYRDVQDFEFTVEEGRLFMLQTRRAARTGIAALRIAVDMVEEGLLTKREAIERVEPDHLDQVLHPVLDPAARRRHERIATGLPASPGAAAGAIVFTSEEAARRGARERVILLRVRANADVPRDAKIARQLGAEGIGLCRTEHMFFAPERIPHVVTMILNAQQARDAGIRIARLKAELAEAPRSERPRIRKELEREQREGREPIRAFHGALAKLLPLQRSDFKGLFLAMEGCPVTIRTLDPPLHEFLPKRDQLERELAALGRARKDDPRRLRLARTLAKVEELHEFNPMLGF